MFNASSFDQNDVRRTHHHVKLCAANTCVRKPLIGLKPSALTESKEGNGWYQKSGQCQPDSCWNSLIHHRIISMQLLGPQCKQLTYNTLVTVSRRRNTTNFLWVDWWYSKLRWSRAEHQVQGRSTNDDYLGKYAWFCAALSGNFHHPLRKTII